MILSWEGQSQDSSPGSLSLSFMFFAAAIVDPLHCFFCKGKLSLVIPAFLCFLYPVEQLLGSPHDPDAFFKCLFMFGTKCILEQSFKAQGALVSLVGMFLVLRRLVDIEMNSPLTEPGRQQPSGGPLWFPPPFGWPFLKSVYPSLELQSKLKSIKSLLHTSPNISFFSSSKKSSCDGSC